jgi:hypothetical protein
MNASERKENRAAPGAANGAGFSIKKGIQGNRERTRKGAKFERQEDKRLLTDVAFFRGSISSSELGEARSISRQKR